MLFENESATSPVADDDLGLVIAAWLITLETQREVISQRSSKT